MDSKRNFSVSGHIADVASRSFVDGTLYVSDGVVSDIVPGAVPQDAPYVLPGLVDAHIHIESTLMTPAAYAALAVEKGVVAVCADPHEIANVAGMEGIDAMMRSGRRVRFHFNFEAPSCVPCTGFETSGACLGPEELAELLRRDGICCEGEFMNAFGVVSGDPVCLAKIKAAKDAGKPVDGHAPGVEGDMLKTYVAAGISTDHECTTIAQARERLALGMKIIIREGSAACDYDALSPLLAEHSGSLMFCSDDKYPDELQEGYIDALVRRSIAAGYPVWNVLAAACITPVEHYGLRHGLLRKGDGADFIVVDSLGKFNVQATYIDGRKVWDGRRIDEDAFVLDPAPEKELPNRFAAAPLSEKDIEVPYEGGRLKVIVAEDLSLLTGKVLVEPKVEGGCVVADPDADVLKLIVYNRYVPAAPAVAFIKGFALRGGAMASTIAHDSHNIVAIGCDDASIVRAVNSLVQMRGGMVVCAPDGEVCGMPLPFGGLMSPDDGHELSRTYVRLKAEVARLGCPLNAPFMTMAFMALPVIPALKLSDKGLFDVATFSFTSLFEK